LDLIIGVTDTLLRGKEVCQLLLIMNAFLDLAELGKLCFELFLIHLFVEVFAHDLD
jgi:hypothetical protein